MPALKNNLVDDKKTLQNKNFDIAFAAVNGVHTSLKKLDFPLLSRLSGLLGAAAFSQTLSQRLNECIPSRRLGTRKVLSS